MRYSASVVISFLVILFVIGCATTGTNTTIVLANNSEKHFGRNRNSAVLDSEGFKDKRIVPNPAFLGYRYDSKDSQMIEVEGNKTVASAVGAVVEAVFRRAGYRVRSGVISEQDMSPYILRGEIAEFRFSFKDSKFMDDSVVNVNIKVEIVNRKTKAMWGLNLSGEASRQSIGSLGRLEIEKLINEALTSALTGLEDKLPLSDLPA